MTGHMISPEEMQRRRRHVEVAITDSRLEGIDEPSAEERAVFEAYIRGEIEAGELVEAYQQGRFKPRARPTI
jgi:Antitoxin VbhA